MKEQLMSRKYKLRWQDRGILIAFFILLATIIAYVADSSELDYKRAEKGRALQAAKLVARSFRPSLAQADSVSRELAQTTVNDQGRVTNFAKRSQELLEIDYVQGSYLVSKAGNWQSNSGVSPELKQAYQQFRQGQCGKYAVTKKRTVMQGPVTLKGGEAGLIFYRPVFVKGQLWGFAVVVAKARQLLKESLANLDQGEYNYRILKSPVESKKYSLLTRSKAGVVNPVAFSFKPATSSGGWKIYVSPKTGWTYEAKARRMTAYTALLALLIFCLITILVLRLGHMRFLKKEATVDALTQINNRLGFDEELKRRLKGQEDGKFTLVMIDVDDFKLFNDLYGHQVGDKVLKQVARGLKEAVTGCGLVGRTGGDEFTIALLGMDADDCQTVIQRILTADHKIDYFGQKIKYSLSIGYADSPRQGKKLASLISRADEALYEVKLSGKSGAQYYSGETSKPLRSQLGFTLHDIAANIPAALLIYKPENGRILFVNQGTLRLLGYDNLWDFFGRVNTKAVHIVAPRDMDRVEVWLKKFTAEAETGDVHKLTYHVISQSGQEIAVKANFSMVDNPHYGKLVYQTMTTA